MDWLHLLPTVNAGLNTTSFILLSLGWRAIRRKNVLLHRNLMIAALTVSTVFLSSYLYYHAHVGATRYQGQGLIRWFYFTILITHTVLATAIVPFILAAVYFAVRRRFVQHVKITRWLMPTWIYVSLTGVIIYLMLYVFKP